MAERFSQKDSNRKDGATTGGAFNWKDPLTGKF